MCVDMQYVTVPSLWKSWHLLSVCLITIPPDVLSALDTHRHGWRPCTPSVLRYTVDSLQKSFQSSKICRQTLADNENAVISRSLFLEEAAYITSCYAKLRGPNIAPGVFNARSVRSGLGSASVIYQGVLHSTTTIFITQCGLAPLWDQPPNGRAEV